MQLKHILVPLILALPAGIGILYFLTSMQLDGTVTISRGDRTGPIEIYHDNFGIPRIFANSLEDAYYGLGWTHAQHRLW